MERSMTKADAHALVWSMPVRELAREWQISEPALRQICLRAGIPLPPRGHWNKLHAGKPSPVISLAPRGIGESDRVYLGTRRHQYGSAAQRERHEEYEREQRDGAIVPPPPVFEEPIEDVRARVAKSVRIVSARPTQTHPLAEALLDELKKRIDAPRAYWQRTERIDAPIEKRRIRFLNAILIGLKREGYVCERSPMWSENGPTFAVRIGDMAVTFAIRVVTSRARGEKAAASRLRFELRPRARDDAERTWEDQPADPIDRHVTEIVVALIVAGEELYRSLKVEHHELLVTYAAELEMSRKREAEAAAAAVRERERQQQETRVAELEGQASDFRRANDIRAYVEEVRAHASRQGMQAASVESWASWALARADRLDPVLSGRFLGVLAE